MKTGRRRGGCFLRVLLVLVVLAVVAAGAIGYFLLTPYRGFQPPIFVDIPLGTTTAGIAHQLAEAGVIHHPWQFMLVRLIRAQSRLQAGEYRFAQADSPWNVFNRIVRGDVYYYEVTIPEGSNIFDIAKILDQTGILKGKDFLKIARSPELIRGLAPGAPSLEGYLFPSTYRFTRHTSMQHICRMMTEQFRRTWNELAKPGAERHLNEVVTLASLVEKETGIASDRPVVASVYANRLSRGMKLECDPTTIYAALLEERYHGVIHRSDLDSTSPYNTYQHAGLPPGPIANPGLASLKAALQPAKTEYLFFVAKPDGSGGHNFSTSLAEHNRHVQEYRAGTKR
jgi:UPF0755 protein